MQNSLEARRLLDFMASTIPLMPNGQPCINLSKAVDTTSSSLRVEFFQLVIYLLSNRLLDSQFDSIVKQLLKSCHNRKILLDLLGGRGDTMRCFAESLAEMCIMSDEGLTMLLLRSQACTDSTWCRLISNINYPSCYTNILSSLLHLRGAASVEVVMLVLTAMWDGYNTHVANALLSLGVDGFSKDLKGRTLLISAIRNSDIDVVSLILRSKPEPILEMNKCFYPAIAVAAQFGSIDMLRLVTEIGPPLSGKQAAHHLGIALPGAVFIGSLRRIEWLLSLGADVNTMGRVWHENGHTALHTGLQVAVLQNNTELALLLLESGASPREWGHMEYEYNEPVPPLHAAARHGNLTLVRCLLNPDSLSIYCIAAEFDVGILTQDIRGSVLVAAVESGEASVVEAILAFATFTNHLFTDEKWALELACIYGYQDIVEILLDLGVRSEAALAEAASGGHFEIIKLLLLKRSGGDISNALQHAARNGHTEAFKLLLRERSRITYPAYLDTDYSNSGVPDVQLATLDIKLISSCLSEGAKCGSDKIIDLLLSYVQTSISSTHSVSFKGLGTSAIHFLLDHAVCNNHTKIVELLLSYAQTSIFSMHDVAFERLDQRVIYSCLEMIAGRGSDEIIDLVLSYAQNSISLTHNVPFKHIDPSVIHSCLTKAVFRNHLETVELLLSYARTSTPFATQYPAQYIYRELLGYFCMHSSESLLIKMFHLLHGEWGEELNPSNPSSSSSSSSSTVLQQAIAHDQFQLAIDMLKSGIYANGRALQYAVKKSHSELVDMLLRAGADVNAAPHEYRGATALQSAAKENNIAIVHTLLAAGAFVNAEPAMYRGATALQLAAANGNFAIAGALLDAGAEINALPAKIAGFTALEGAALYGRLDMVRFLLNAGADITGPTNPQYRRAVGMAWMEGHITLAAYLQEYKANIYGKTECEPLDKILAAPDVVGWNIDIFWADHWGINLDHEQTMPYVRRRRR